MEHKKINLAVIFYGHIDQRKTNIVQFKDLEKNLSNFCLKKYNFDKAGKRQLRKDFKEGKIDIVLKNSYGRANEADIELFLEHNQIPFMGSSSATTIIGTSKFLSKKIFRLHNLPVAKDIFVDKLIWQNAKQKILKEIKKNIKYPCMIKDVGGTDSRGIFLVSGEKQCVRILNSATRKYKAVIIEKYIKDAYETTVMVVGNKKKVAYEPVGFNKKGKAIFTGKMKDAHSVNLDVPAHISKKIANRIKKIAKIAHRALGGRTFSRADVLVKGNKLYLLEVDVHPGFRVKSATSLSANLKGENLNSLFLKFYKLSQ